MTMYHSSFSAAFKLMKAKQAILLTGEKGTGKTTLAIQLTEKLGLTFYTMSMTRQTTLSLLLGFMNVNGIYVPSQIRTAAENGGVVLLDEIDAGDPNVLLCLNSIENGYIAFPDKVVQLHKDFHLMATSNPQDNHKDYNGRAKLDAATLDRFDIIDIELEAELEQTLVDKITYLHVQLIRKCLTDAGSSTYVSMRDSMRFQLRKELKIMDGFIERLLKKDRSALERYNEQKIKIPEVSSIDECENILDVWKFASSI
jgi:MoxR-like ATPase